MGNCGGLGEMWSGSVSCLVRWLGGKGLVHIFLSFGFKNFDVHLAHLQRWLNLNTRIQHHMYIGGFLKWWYPTTIGFNTHMGSCQNPVMVDEYSIRSYEGTFISLHYPRRKTKNSLFQCLGRTIYVHTYVQIIVFHSKGNVGYPWECTLAVVPPILPHIALYNHCIIHI